jgi:chemotaxis protein histidine kinase CheA
MNNNFLQDFFLDSVELLNIIEDSFFKIEKGERFEDHFDQIFRSLHSLKGISGMFDFSNISNATHVAEGLLKDIQKKGKINQRHIDYFIAFIDQVKNCIQSNDMTSKIDIQLVEQKLPPPITEKEKSLSEASVELHLDLKTDLFAGCENEKFLFDLEMMRQVVKSNFKPMILVVDDEEAIHKLLKKMIKMDSLIIDVLNAKQAKCILSFCDPHLVITDVKMPGESEIDLLKDIAKKHVNIPVIMISGNATTSTSIDSLNNGAFHFLEKPFDKKDLNDAIKKGLLKRMKNYIAEMKNHKN